MESFEMKMEFSETGTVSVSDVPHEKKKLFCQIWPAAKPGLTMLIQFIPNTIVRGLAMGLITYGDGLAAKFCE